MHLNWQIVGFPKHLLIKGQAEQGEWGQEQSTDYILLLYITNYHSMNWVKFRGTYIVFIYTCACVCVCVDVFICLCVCIIIIFLSETCLLIYSSFCLLPFFADYLLLLFPLSSFFRFFLIPFYFESCFNTMHSLSYDGRNYKNE